MKSINNQPKKKYRPLDGILLLDKPRGVSSNRILQQIKHLYQAEKAGHAGTLDPMATGMLPICFGEATKFSTQLLNNHKTYEFTCTLGAKTESGDQDGIILATKPIPELTQLFIEENLNAFIGVIEQIPPMVSALHHQGKRLYELAREGIEVERKKRAVTISTLTLCSFNTTSFTAHVSCSKGTYVRTLAEDIALRMGTFGYLTDLRRTAIYPYMNHCLYTLETLSTFTDDLSALETYLLPMDSALIDYPVLIFNAQETHRLFLGQKIPVIQQLTDPCYRLYDDDQNFLGIGIPHNPYVIAPKRMIKRL